MTGRIRIDENLYTAIHKCTRCGQCTYGNGEAGFEELCPLQMKGRFFTYSAGGLMQVARALYEGKIPFSESIRDLVYLCTTCGACEVNCGVIGDQVDIFTIIKGGLRENGVPLMEAHRVVEENMLKSKAPYGGRLAGRNAWLSKDLRKSLSPRSEVFYYVGCVSSYRETEIPSAFAGILSTLGISFTVSDEEWCCGAPLYFSGNEEGARDYARHNVGAIEESGASTVVITCPTCSLMFKKYYPRWLKGALDFQVLHVTEYLEGLMEEGVLKLGSLQEEMRVSFHDPCHLGRGQGVYDAPRKILAEIGGLEMAEARRSKQNSLCCGGGGLLTTGFPDHADFLANQRVMEMKDTGADLILSACPACKENLKIAARKTRPRKRVLDLVELVGRVLV
ncbi:MAG: (Fe-S)-binding protein [Deltaproteobacteria bacterium]|nr:(Fe-S)-binding protein [Deltaproteobacteria bacterium]